MIEIKMTKAEVLIRFARILKDLLHKNGNLLVLHLHMKKCSENLPS